jgi:hypothetical protein
METKLFMRKHVVIKAEYFDAEYFDVILIVEDLVFLLKLIYNSKLETI